MRISTEEAFRRLAIGEPGFVDVMGDAGGRDRAIRALDCRTDSLVRLAALIAIDAPPASYRSVIESAQRAGARLDDFLAVLLALTGTVGTARVIAAAPHVALAAGYDVEAALE